MDENSFDSMTDFQKLYEAYRRAAAGKRNKQEVIDFELDLSRNLWEIIHQMEDKAYWDRKIHNARIEGYFCHSLH